MFPRSLSLVRAARTASRLQAVRCASGGDVTVHHPSAREVAMAELSAMDHITVPQGSWQEDYNKRQARYHRNIIVNFVICAALFAWVKESGALRLYGGPSLKGIDVFEED